MAGRLSGDSVNGTWDSSGVSQALAGWLPYGAIRCLPKAQTIAERPPVWHGAQCGGTRQRQRPRSAPQGRRKDSESGSFSSGIAAPVKKLGCSTDQNGNVIMFVR